MQKFHVITTDLAQHRVVFSKQGMRPSEVARYVAADLNYAEWHGEMDEQEWINATGRVSRLSREGGILNAGSMQYAVARQVG